LRFAAPILPPFIHIQFTDSAARGRNEKAPEALRFQGFLSWSKWRDSNPRPFGPEPTDDFREKDE